MEDSIGSFCKTLASFCNHLHSSCHALKQSVDRRPIPLGPSSFYFFWFVAQTYFFLQPNSAYWRLKFEFCCFVLTDSASSTFVQCLKRRISSASSDLNLLETMSFGTVSFEELLGHCSEVYKKNQSDLSELEDRLRDYGYVPSALLYSCLLTLPLVAEKTVLCSADCRFLFCFLLLFLASEQSKIHFPL